MGKRDGVTWLGGRTLSSFGDICGEPSPYAANFVFVCDPDQVLELYVARVGVLVVCNRGVLLHLRVTYIDCVSSVQLTSVRLVAFNQVAYGVDGDQFSYSCVAISYLDEKRDGWCYYT